MGGEIISLPPGFRFKPRDDELINFYLKPKILGQKLSCHIINDDIQVYSPDSTPWVLFDLDNPDSWVDSTTNTEKTLYVFTTLSKLVLDSNNTTTRTRSNTSKKAGCGTWVQRTKRVPIIDRDGNVIGGKRMLNFEIHEIEAGFDLDKAVYFKMHEYSLWGVNESLGCDDGDVVLCEITFDPCRKPFRKLVTKTTDQVSRRGRKPQNKKQNNKNFEGSGTSMSKSVPVMNCNIFQESTTSLHQESLVDVGNDDWIATASYDTGVQNLSGSGGGMCFDGQGGDDLCFDGQGVEGMCFDDLDDDIKSFDISGFMEFMKSNPQVEPLEDNRLGKRKSIEGNNSCQTKKMCF